MRPIDLRHVTLPEKADLLPLSTAMKQQYTVVKQLLHMQLLNCLLSIIVLTVLE